MPLLISRAQKSIKALFALAEKEFQIIEETESEDDDDDEFEESSSESDSDSEQYCACDVYFIVHL